MTLRAASQIAGSQGFRDACCAGSTAWWSCPETLDIRRRASHLVQPLRGRTDAPAPRSSVASVRWCTPNLLATTASDAPPVDAGLVEVTDDRCSMYSVQAGERVDRRAVSIEADQSIDLGRRQSSLDRV